MNKYDRLIEAIADEMMDNDWNLARQDAEDFAENAILQALSLEEIRYLQERT